MTGALPEPIAEYFERSNSDDAAGRVADCFTEDGIVHDERQHIHGRDAIRAWATEVRRKYRFHAEVSDVETIGDRTIVTAHLTGDFPGSPIDLRYRFKLAGPEIASLEIG